MAPVSRGPSSWICRTSDLPERPAPPTVTNYMFESLTDKLSSALRNLRGVGKLTEDNMADALKEVRTALLSADVHFKVAREFVDRVQAQFDGLKRAYADVAARLPAHEDFLKSQRMWA